MSEFHRYIDVRKLPRGQRWFFDHFESLGKRVRDGRSVRSSVWLGVLYTILGCTVGLFLVKIPAFLLVLVFNMRNLDWRNGLNPLVWNEDGWPLESYHTQSSRWIQDKFGDYYHPALRYWNPWWAAAFFVVTWAIANVFFHQDWNFLDALKYMPYAFIALVIVYVLAAVKQFRRWLNEPRRPEPKFTRL